MRRRSVLWGAAALAGCASPEWRVGPGASIFHDELFGASDEAMAASEIFALSPAMRAWIDDDVSGAFRRRGPHYGLIEALREPSGLKMTYDATLTRNAAQAFEARAGNCLSLVIMTAVLARALGLRIDYQQVDNGGVWDRSASLVYSLGHVNLRIGKQIPVARWSDSDGDWITIDFLESEVADGVRSWSIGESRIVSMFMNNRAVESLVAGRSDAAYAWSRASIEADPRHVDAYNTLGVIYLRHGNKAAAEAAWRFALKLPVPQPLALGNLADLMESTGRTAEALGMRAELQRIQPVTPLKDYDDGLKALALGDAQRARRAFEREVKRGIHFHELHLNLARAYLMLGVLSRVQEHLELARKYSTTHEQQALYSAKLARLKQVQAQ